MVSFSAYTIEKLHDPKRHTTKGSSVLNRKMLTYPLINVAERAFKFTIDVRCITIPIIDHYIYIAM